MRAGRALLVLPVVGLAAATGCTGEPGSGDEPTTARALAAVAAEHAGEPSAGRAEPDAVDELAPGAVGAALRYDGAQLVLAVGEGLDPPLTGCAGLEDEADGCEERDGVVVLWEAETPEEDPGVVYVVAPKGDGVSALAWLSGPPVTGDPAELDLPVPVDTMVELVLDPRVGLTTSQEALDAGAELAWWEAGD